MIRSRFTTLQSVLDYTMWIPDTGCQLWLGEKTPDGYGLITKNGKRIGAHRIVKEMELGRELGSEEWVLHKCDTPSCIRLDHLFIGTAKDNTADKLRKGRANIHRGDTHPCSPLTSKDVLAIRKLHA